MYIIFIQIRIEDGIFCYDLEDTLNIIISMENTEHMAVSKDDTSMMEDCCPCDFLVDEHFKDVLDAVNSGHVDHHLNCHQINIKEMCTVYLSATNKSR